MRISTNMVYSSGVKGINDQWAATLKLQQQIASGSRILTPSDDPVAAAQAVNVQQLQDINTQFATNINSATSALSLESTQLGSVVDIFGRLKELVVQAGDTTLTSTQRSAIAVELRSRFQGLVAIANAQNGTGQYLFSGYQGDTTPFSGSVDGGVTYSGDDGQQQIQISSSRVIATSDSGSAVFDQIMSGNGTFATDYTSSNTGTGIIDSGTVSNSSAWVAPTNGHYSIAFTVSGGTTTYQIYDGDPATGTALLATPATYVDGQAIELQKTTTPAADFGASVTITGTPANGDSYTVTPSTDQSLFTTLSKLIHAIENTGTSTTDAANYQTDLKNANTNLSNALNNVLQIQTMVGARLNEISSVSDNNASLKLRYASTLSDLQDLDTVTATSELAERQTQLQAAEKSFAAINQLSLFSYL